MCLTGKFILDIKVCFGLYIYINTKYPSDIEKQHHSLGQVSEAVCDIF